MAELLVMLDDIDPDGGLTGHVVNVQEDGHQWGAYESKEFWDLQGRGGLHPGRLGVIRLPGTPVADMEHLTAPTINALTQDIEKARKYRINMQQTSFPVPQSSLFDGSFGLLAALLPSVDVTQEIKRTGSASFMPGDLVVE